MKMTLGYDKQPEDREHWIYIKDVREWGEVFYSKFPCYDVMYYQKMMESEFNKKATS